MSDVGAAGSNAYQVAGYKEGDRIGAGVVVDPAKLTKGADTKLVTVDLDMNNKVDPTDDQVVVKLPPKGVVPVNWNGVAKVEGGGKAGFVLKDIQKPLTTGAIAGGLVGIAATLPMLAKGSGDPLAAVLTCAGVGIAVGAAIGGMAGSNNGKSGRYSYVGLGIVGGAGAALGYSIAGSPKGLAIMAGAALAGAAIGGASQLIGKTQELSEDKQKARASSVPDMVPPKFILNQYLMKQTESK